MFMDKTGGMLKYSNQQARLDPILLSTVDVMHLLRISDDTIRRLRAQRKLRGVRQGRRVYYYFNEVMSYAKRLPVA
jgi:excisionase family DNA binding protein